MDFYFIKFIFYYVDQKDFNKAVDNHYMCKKYISKSINNFERYYDDYIDYSPRSKKRPESVGS